MASVLNMNYGAYFGGGGGGGDDECDRYDSEYDMTAGDTLRAVYEAAFSSGGGSLHVPATVGLQGAGGGGGGMQFADVGLVSGGPGAVMAVNAAGLDGGSPAGSAGCTTVASSSSCGDPESPYAACDGEDKVAACAPEADVKLMKKRRLAANARERRRMQSLNRAFDRLRTVLPTIGNDRQLSKYETLQMAQTYITALYDLLQ